MHLLLPRRMAGESGPTRVYWEYSPSDAERAEVAAWIDETDGTDLEFLAIEQTVISMHGTRDGAHVMVSPRRCSNLTNDLICALAELRHEIRR
jgi:hypothetical protein